MSDEYASGTDYPIGKRGSEEVAWRNYDPALAAEHFYFGSGESASTSDAQNSLYDRFAPTSNSATDDAGEGPPSGQRAGRQQPYTLMSVSAAPDYE